MTTSRLCSVTAVDGGCTANVNFVSLPVYRRLSTSTECWFCGACQLPPFHDSLFEPTRSSSPPTPSQPANPRALSSSATGPVAPRDNNRRPRNHLNIWYSNVRSV
ncbi:unnamed protein product [Ixodes pacificus]